MPRSAPDHTVQHTRTPKHVTAGSSRRYHHLYGRKWKAARALFLQSNPLCKRCQRRGEIKAADVVDHVVPHKGDLELFWDQSNWQPLCKRDHDIKTATEDTDSAAGVGGSKV